jgi:hypothetical protein
VAEEPVGVQPWHCLFCRMPTGVRLLGIPLCGICRDQMQDFIWASGIQGGLVAIGVLGGLQFLGEEVLLFGVLVLIKHRLPSLLDRFVRSA